MRLRVLILALGLVAVAAACGDGQPVVYGGTASAPTTTMPTGVDLSKATFVDDTNQKAVEVDAVDNNFQDQYVEVKVGTTVTFTNAGHNEHNLQPAVEGQFEGATTDHFEPGTSHKVTFKTPGDYPYYCTLHGSVMNGMTGAIRVVS